MESGCLIITQRSFQQIFVCSFTPTRMEVVTIQLVIETISFASSYMHVLFAFLWDHAAHELITVLNTVASIWKSKNYWRKFDSKSMKTTASEY